jgi:hypothetical protein
MNPLLTSTAFSQAMGEFPKADDDDDDDDEGEGGGEDDLAFPSLPLSRLVSGVEAEFLPLGGVGGGGTSELKTTRV